MTLSQQLFLFIGWYTSRTPQRHGTSSRYESRYETVNLNFPQVKYGKSYRYEGGFGESYEHIGDDTFEEILDTDVVFPGYLSCMVGDRCARLV